MAYMIEAQVKGNWIGDAVGEPNEFETPEEAEEMIPELARIFECAKEDFRVVEIK